MRPQDGDRTPEQRRKGRTLSVSDPLISRVLAGITIEGCDIAQIECWGKSLNADAKRWVARGRFGERGQITKLDAEMMWRRELAGAGAK
jgi:hypothetical protein